MSLLMFKNFSREVSLEIDGEEPISYTNGHAADDEVLSTL